MTFAGCTQRAVCLSSRRQRPSLLWCSSLAPGLLKQISLSNSYYCLVAERKTKSVVFTARFFFHLLPRCFLHVPPGRAARRAASPSLIFSGCDLRGQAPALPPLAPGAPHPRRGAAEGPPGAEPLPHAVPPRCWVQAALPNACWQLLPPAPRGRAAAQADEMRPDGPAMLYNGLRHKVGAAGTGPPLRGWPRMG